MASYPDMLTSFSVAADDQLLKIPYRASQGSGSPNMGYVDLKAQPERIAEIPELTGYPELEELVRVLNKQESSFRTLRVDTAKDVFRRPEFSKSESSHLTISFENLGGEDDERFYMEAHRSFSSYVSLLPVSDAIVINFVAVPLQVQTFRGWCLDLWLYGFGKSEDEARRNWLSGLTILREFLLRLDEENRDNLN
jgi:hypothetical protein